MVIKRIALLCLMGLWVVPSWAGLVEDWSKRPDVEGAKLSPLGNYLAVLKEIDEKRRVVVFDYPSMKYRSALVYPGDNEVGSFWWANDDRIIATIVEDFSGLESGRSYGELFAMNADGSKPKHVFGFRAGARSERLTRIPQISNEYASAYIIDYLDDDPEEILINIRYWSRGFSNVTEAAHLNIYTGKLSQKVRAPVSNSSMASDSDGNIRFAFSTNDDQDSVIHQRDLETRRWSVFSKTPYGQGGMQPLKIAEDGRIYVSYGPGDGPAGIYLLEPKTQKLEKIYQHDLVDAYLRLDRNDDIYGVEVMPDKLKFVPLDSKHPRSKLIKALAKIFPDSVPTITSGTRDNSLLVARLVNPGKTPEFYLYNSKEKKLELLFDSRPDFDDKLLANQRPVMITARDGMEMHGYLNLPAGHEAKNLPFIIVPHGGPHGPRDEWGFDWFAGILPAAGYATLQINYRGSGGYGVKYERAGHREWAKKMQDDLTDATQWAIRQGIADPERVCIFGWSYGGYATVMSISREPDLYKCAAAGAGVYDNEIQYNQADFASQTRWGKKYMDKVIGSTKQDRLFASPAHYVHKIKTPLLLVHGEEDARVPVEHLDSLLKAYKKADKKRPEVLRLKKEAHTPRAEKNFIKMWTTILAFVEKHIGPGVKVPGDLAPEVAAN